MPSTRFIQTNFTAGEVSRRLIGRGDLRAYENGALTLRNVFIHPTGGVTRRAGLYYMATLEGPGRLVEFEFNTEQTYLLVFLDEEIRIYQNDALIDTLSSPWDYDDLAQISWCQNADTLLVTHPDIAPRKITRTESGWALDAWEFFTGTDNIIQQPYYKFAATPVTLTAAATSGTNITLTASADVFVNDHEGTRFRIQGKEVLIVDVQSPTVAKMDIVQTLPGTSATLDWQEQSFSAVRGWPVSCAFHQDRLVIGGSRDLPNRLWLSRSGDIFNFDLGTSLDDESIEFAIVSDQVNAIRAVFSGRHLQVFTSGAEWMVSGNPLTPKTFQINRQTRIGSIVQRTVPPVDVDGATLFLSRDGKAIREFIYTDLEQAYSSNDLSLLANHLLVNPIEIAFDKSRRLFCVVRGDGRLGMLTLYRAEAVVAWTLMETDGEILSVAVVDDQTCFLVDRDGVYTIERLDDDILLDSALIGESEELTTAWSGLDHLEGRDVQVIADGELRDAVTVTEGEVVIDPGALSVQIGLPYTHVIEPLPPNVLGTNGAGRALRLVEAVFRLEDTAALRVDLGRGLQDVTLRRLTGEEFLDQPPPNVTGDIGVRALGWTNDVTQPLWRIEQDTPLPFTLLSTTTEIKVTD